MVNTTIETIGPPSYKTWQASPRLRTIAAEYDEAAADGLARNLIYVAMTRAMDNLNVFLMEETKEKAVVELVGALGGVTHDVPPT